MWDRVSYATASTELLNPSIAKSISVKDEPRSENGDEGWKIAILPDSNALSTAEEITGKIAVLQVVR